MKTRIISFYSDVKDSYYSDSAAKLKQKCINFDVPYDIIELPSKKSYMLNCLQKPKFIKNMMEKYNEPLIWMDCDTDFKDKFTTFDNLKEDIGFASHTGTIEGIKASPLFFNNSSNFNLIINTWIEACENGLKNNGFELDHDALKHSVLPKIIKNISIYIIKENYNDYCNGKFINNGNSHTVGKKEVMRMLTSINKKRPAL